MKTAAILFVGSGPRAGELVSRVYGPPQRAALEAAVDLHPHLLHPEDLRRPELRETLARTELIFTTWGMPKMDEAMLASLPKLRAVYYAAGSVQGFARPLLDKGIDLYSAWAANAIPVAEFTVAQTILALKRAPQSARALYGNGTGGGPTSWRHQHVIGAYGSTVALISLGMIGQRVVELLKAFKLHVIAYEPYPKPGLAESLGVELVSLDECFRRGDVVSLHAPNLPATKRMIRGRHFELMRPSTTFINTARGAIIDEPEMIAALAKRPDLTAFLDVTDPEPPAEGSPLYRMPNIFLTPHIAGSIGNEVSRLADFMIEEHTRTTQGHPPRYQVTEPMLETMA